MVPECLAGIVVSRLTLTKITSFHLCKIFWESKHACNNFLNLFPSHSVFSPSVFWSGKEYLSLYQQFYTLEKQHYTTYIILTVLHN